MEKLVIFNYYGGHGPERSSNPWQINIISRDIFNVTVLQAMKQPAKLTPNVQLLNCLVYIGRHFGQALDENKEMTQHALTKIQHIYKIERQCDEAGLSYDERIQKCQELARPIMEIMKIWMET